MNLANRLSLFTTTTVACILLACFASAYVLVERDEERDLDEELTEMSAVAALSLAQSKVASAAAAQPDKTSERFSIAWYSAEHALELQNPAFHGEAPLFVATRPPTDAPVHADIQLRFDKLRAAYTRTANGTLLVATSRKAIESDMRFLRNVFSGLLAIGLCVALLASRLVARGIAGDILQIGAVTRRVTSGDLGARLAPAELASLETQALGREINVMIEDLETMLATQRVFVSHAAHELRSPIATLRGELQLCLRKPRSEAHYLQTLLAADEQAEALGTLAEDLLALARARDRTQPERHANLRAEAVVNAAVGACRGLATAKAIDIQVDASTCMAENVAGGSADVARALRNLLDNAMMHSAHGTTIALQLRHDAGCVVFAVQDHGGGVAAEDVPHLFVPFWRGQTEQGSATGSGLGLSIAREIARKYAGDVQYAREQTVDGARFELRLPKAV